MTTSTKQILRIMNALPKADNTYSDSTLPSIAPPAVPTPDQPRPKQDIGEVLAHCLGAGKKPINTPR